MKKKLFFIAFILLFAIIFYTPNVYAGNKGSGDYCLSFNVGYEGGFSSSNVKSIKINNIAWEPGDIFHGNVENGKLWIIEFVLTKNGNEYPFVSTPGGLIVEDENDPNYPGYGTYRAIPNPDNDDEFFITVTLKDTWPDKGTANSEACGGYGVTITSGPQIEAEKYEVTSKVSITIKGEELEYHYVADKPNEADVTYFKFDINGGTEEERLVPFTFGNANYTYNDKEPPKNVTQVTTKQPITYKYLYNGSGKVEFCVNGGQTDEYTSIKINGVEYSQYAAHTKEDYWETTDGWAQMFCIPEVPYSDTYNVVVEGKQTADENKIPGFGWSYLTKERSTDIDEEGNFAHGRLVFVSASLVIDGEEKTFGSANTFNNYKYHNKGYIFQWGEGNKEYSEEDRRMAWGSAKMPYGTTLRVRIVPDKGYQLTGLAVNENGFKPTETPGEYELTLTRTNLSYNEDQNQFDLNPTFEKIDATATSNASSVPNVVLTINKGENAFETGTPKLEVTDVSSMSPEREKSFDDAVNDGFTINNYLEISLYNTLYKGGKKENNKLLSWDTEVHELENNATISLELEDALDGDEVELIHEVRDNDNKIVGYDVINAQYDKKTNTITFETDGFSTYAISVKKTGNEEANPDQKEMVKVEFDTRSDIQIKPVEIEKGSKVSKPVDPTNEGYILVGWYTDENCENEFDFNTPVNKDLVLFAKWSDKVQRYTLSDKNGNSIAFNEIKDREYNLTMFDVIPLTDDELKAINATREQYNEVKNMVIKATSKFGELLAFYQIEIEDKDDKTIISEGPFDIKIKITDEMRKYNEFKLIYLNDNFEPEEIVELKVENGYLVGKIPHLSSYTLVGNYNANLPDVPKTGDNIYTWVLILLISIIGITLSTKYMAKASKVRIK